MGKRLSQPSPFGQGIYAQSIIQFLDNAFLTHIDYDDKITAHNMPEMIDEFCYDNGVLIEAANLPLQKRWFVDESWNPNDGLTVRRNYVDVPFLICETPGIKYKFKFSGNTIGFTVAAGPDTGILEYRIDKGDWKSKNLFSKHSRNLHIPIYVPLEVGLSSGKHTIEIKLSEKKDELSTGTACRIRYFFVNED